MNLQTNTGTRSRSRLKEYSLGAAAIASGVFGLAPQDASAAIVTFSDSGSFLAAVANAPFTSIDITLADGSGLNLTGDAFELAFNVGASSSGVGLWDNAGVVYGIGPYVIPSILGTNVNINPSYPPSVWMPFVATAFFDNTQYGDWATSFTDQFIGFLTTAGNEGYLKVSWDHVSGLFSYNGGAIENTGADLMTPGGAAPAAVPEPGVLALLAAGAVGLARRRRAVKLAA